MALSDTRIHQIELLLTLDYLLNYTDEENPATQIDVCEHARKYGLKFDKNAKQGNQVRRQRIGDCFKFLKEVSDNFAGDVPFVLETTDSGKYYIEQKHGLNEGQVAKILAAISNDKYTKDEDVNFLIDRVLDAFSTDEKNKDIINTEYKRLLKGVKKYGKETIRKINLVEKAYREGKMIKIKIPIMDERNGIIVNYYFWYRVYMIKEFHSKPYTFMLPIGQINANNVSGRLKFFNDYIFEPIENIDIADESEKNVLCSDLDENRDFDKLFQEKCPKLAKTYGSLDEMLKRRILPHGGKTCIVSFYFNFGVKDILKRSFEDFFSEDFRYQEINTAQGLEDQIKNLVGLINDDTVIIDRQKYHQNLKRGLVNISVDSNSFLSWLLSDPNGDGYVCIADMITIIKPISLNEKIAEYHYLHMMKKLAYLDKNRKEEAIKAFQSETKD